MGWSYNRLWILLIEKDMSKTELRKLSGITTNTLAKMGKKEPVPLEALGKICSVLHCELEDIVQYVPNSDT